MLVVERGGGGGPQRVYSQICIPSPLSIHWSAEWPLVDRSGRL